MMDTNDDATGGSAFPISRALDILDHPGMTLRDWFATTIDKDEYGDIISRNLPRETAELLAGAHPVEPGPKSVPQEQRIEYRLACLAWEFRVRAALRYMMADAMIAERSK